MATSVATSSVQCSGETKIQRQRRSDYVICAQSPDTPFTHEQDCRDRPDTDTDRNKQRHTRMHVGLQGLSH